MRATCSAIDSSPAAVWLLALALWLAVAGCRKSVEQDPEPQMPPPITASEAERGRDACQAYVDRVCACARSKPDNTELADQCHMAPAKMRSLQMVLEVNQAPKDAKERVVTGQTVRRIIASCIEAQGSLNSQGCPR